MKEYLLIDNEGERIEVNNRCDDDIIPDVLMFEGHPFVLSDLTTSPPTYREPLSCEECRRKPEAGATPCALTPFSGSWRNREMKFHCTLCHANDCPIPHTLDVKIPGDFRGLRWWLHDIIDHRRIRRAIELERGV